MYLFFVTARRHARVFHAEDKALIIEPKCDERQLLQTSVNTSPESDK